MSEHKTKVEKNNDSDFSHDGGHSLHFYRDVTLVLRMQLRINAKEAEKRHKMQHESEIGDRTLILSSWKRRGEMTEWKRRIGDGYKSQQQADAVLPYEELRACGCVSQVL